MDGAKDGGIIALATQAAAPEIPLMFPLPGRVLLIPFPGIPPISIEAAPTPIKDAGTCTDELRSDEVECWCCGLGCCFPSVLLLSSRRLRFFVALLTV